MKKMLIQKKGLIKEYVFVGHYWTLFFLKKIIKCMGFT